MPASVCPQCGEAVSEIARSEHRCQNCGLPLHEEEVGQQAAAADSPGQGEHISEFEHFAKHPESSLPLDTDWIEAKIRRSSQGETLAVLALLLPVMAQALALAWRFDSMGIEMALSWGTVIVTAVLLAVDAALLGSIDMKGTQRSGPGALFLGMLLLWIVCYPVVFFRRRHFGRPNLGPLAIVVAAFFVGAPFVQQFMHFGFVGSGVPTCDSREVIAMVNDIIRKSSIGPSVQSISDHRGISSGEAAESRKGQCLVKTRTETIRATYTVKMLNKEAGTFQVEVDPIITSDPPFCTDRDVIDLIAQMLREAPNGGGLINVQGHEEISYDQEKKVRHGRCQAAFQGVAQTVTYRFRVYWLDQKAGRFQVEFEP